MPSGQMAQDHSDSPRVKEVGAILAHDHVALDVQVRSISAQLGVPIPDQPNPDQQGWLAEERSKHGADFDLAFANLLRNAHGKVFAAVALVRAGTLNDLIRPFAETANNVVMKHMSLLESIGLVDYGALPEAPRPFAPASERLAGSFGNGPGAPFVWTVLTAAVIACASAAIRAIRPR